MQRIRNHRYYSKPENRAKILQNHREKRIQERNIYNTILQQQNPLPAPKENVVVQVAKPKPKRRLIIVEKSSTDNYTKDQIIQLIKNLNLKINTEKTYISSIKRVYDATNCERLIDCFRDVEKIINDIENALYRGAPYADNSKKLTYMSILIVIDQFLNKSNP